MEDVEGFHIELKNKIKIKSLRCRLCHVLGKCLILSEFGVCGEERPAVLIVCPHVIKNPSEKLFRLKILTFISYLAIEEKLLLRSNSLLLR